MTKQLTEEDRKRQASLATDLTRTLLYLKLSTMEAENLREQLAKSPLKYIAPFAKELVSKLSQAERKVVWFIDTIKKAIGPQNARIIDDVLQPDSSKLANLGQIAEWLITTPRDVSDEVDLVINSGRRKDILMRAWKTALGTPELSEKDQMRFDSWYRANFITSIS